MIHVEADYELTSSRWSMAWQDSHFSLSYDRPSTVAVSQPDIAYRPTSKPGDRSYFETLCRIISLTLELVRGRMLSPQSQMSFNTIQAYKERIQQILTDAAPHLRERKYCLTSMDHLERLALKLHCSYITSELCRPALRANADVKDPATSQMRKDCVESLIKTVEAYVEMHTISSHGARSWISLQRAISSAFLLAVIEESKNNSKVWTLLRQLETVIAERVSAEGSYDSSEAAASTTMTSPQGMSASIPATTTAGHAPFNTIPGMTNAHIPSFDPTSLATTSVPVSMAADTQTQWAKPLIKSLRALQKLNAAFSNQGSPTSGGNNNHTYTGHTTSNANTAAAAAAAGLGPFPPPGSTVTLTPRVSSLPPPTPESSTSGEWTIPNLLDRAAEYIHPPLWG